MKKLLIIATLFSNNALANNSNFTVQMNTNSNAYICNAGMKHSGVDENQYLKNSFSYSVVPYGSAGDYQTSSTSSGSNNFSASFVGAASFENTLNQLTFKLGSDYSGATYFFDVCVRGPETNYFDENPELMRDVNFLLRSNIHRQSEDENGVPNITQDDEYADISKLNVRAFIHCDLQGLGENKFALDSAGEFNPLKSDLDWAALANDQKGMSDYFYESKSIPYEAGNNSLPDTMFITSSANRSQVPRFCVVRYQFTETAILERSLVNFKNKLVLNFDAYPF